MMMTTGDDELKFLATVFLCRALSFAGRLVGKGTDLPGRAALKLYPHVMKRIRFKGRVICVTGSNGKTTTSNMIADMLRSRGYSVLNNAKGSNLTSGICVTLLNGCRLNGDIEHDFVVLEVDECFARFIFEDIRVDYFLILNLLRDQVVRNGNPDLVFEKLKKAISLQPEMRLILNGNDPLSLPLREASSHEPVYFEMERTERSTDECISGTNDCKVCPHCFSKLKFDFFHYNHLGAFYCESCGYKTPEPDYFGSSVDFEAQRIDINGIRMNVSFNTTFNMFNVVSAAAACCTASDMTLEEFAANIGGFQIAGDRLNEFYFEGRKVVLMMTKQNAASVDQSILYALEQPVEKSIVLFLNNILYLNYKDVSWYYDVAFERLSGKVENILCMGERALDAAVCLETAGIDRNIIIYENDLDKTREAFRKTKGDIYILAASAFGHEGRILEALKK